MKFYHRVRKNMLGTKLVSLTTLQRLSSQLAESHQAKYHSKPGKIMWLRPLNCTTLDVIQMFAVPLPLIQARLALFGDPPLRFFEIESDSLDQTCLCVYYRNDKETGEAIIDPFDALLPLDRPGEGFEEWYREEAAKGRRLPLFVGIPHIYYKGEIDVTDCPVVS